MSPKAWIRRGAAAAAASAALIMAFQPAAVGAPRWWNDEPVKHTRYTSYSNHSNQGNHWRHRTRWVAPAAETNQPAETNSKPQTNPADSPNPAPADRGGTAAKILELTNVERAKAGLPPLEHHDCLATTAQNWSSTMNSQKRMYHSDLGTWMRGCSLSNAGENVAYGQRSPEEVVRAWMNSAGHRKNILNAKYKYLGVGISGTYSTQAFGS